MAKGFHQIEGIDYTYSFSPVAKMVTVRVLIIVTTTNQWPIYQVNINNAFLHGLLDEEVYMFPTQGYLKSKSGQVCWLKRSLYGLKQAGRQWNKEFGKKLRGLGFIQSFSDHCLFLKHTPKSFTALLVYVDDVLITGTCEEEI